MSRQAYQGPSLPKPAVVFLPPMATPASVADEVLVLHRVLPFWVACGERFVPWRWQWDPQRGAWRKVPLDPLSPGRYARADDPRTWGTLRDAVAFRRRFAGDGVSRALVDGEGLLGIDLDDCRDPDTAELDELARLTLAHLPEAYCEVSPSGTGLHLFLQAAFPEPGRQGRKRGRVEIYSGARFLTVTGRVLRHGR